jgi:hypothetical protein
MMLYFRKFLLNGTRHSFLTAVKILLLLSFLLCGCVGQEVIYHDHPSGKIPASIAGFMSEDDILSAVVQINASTSDGYYPANAALIIKRPSYLRLEMLPVIGTPDFLLTASPEKMSIFIPSKGKFYYGRPMAANLAKFLPWPLNIEDAVMIFTGTYPPLKDQNVSYQTYQEKNLQRIEMKTQSGCSQMVWLTDDNKLLKIVRNDETGKEAYTVEYFYDETKNSFPEKITINMAQGQASLSVKFSDIKIERTNDLSVFDLPVPPAIEATPLD